ncbi:MAG: hypothetical protein ACYC2Y_03225 [Armatimonadota bacterium]
MPRNRIPVRLVSQICVEPQPKGLRAVYLVETEGEGKAAELSKLFEDFSPAVASHKLSKGKLVAYAVQLREQDPSLFGEIEAFLKKNFGFVIMHRSFDPLIYDIVGELCRDSGSSLLPVPKCDICGKLDPFPETVISFLDKENTSLATRLYCTSCTADSAGRNNKEFLRALLEADPSDLGALREMNLVRSSSKKRIAFRIKAAEQHCAAT